MARCSECRTNNVKISATSSRRSFVVRCVNPGCRHTYVRTMGIAGDLVPVFSAMKRRRLVSRTYGETREPGGDPGEFE